MRGTLSGSSGFFDEFANEATAAADPNPNRAKAQDVADRIASVLREAREIDGGYAKAVRRLRVDPGVAVTDGMWADVNRDAGVLRKSADDYLGDEIPRGKSPKEQKKWWDGLSEEQKEQYLSAYPGQVGKLEGVPAAVRDEANRTYLPMLMGKLEGSDDEQARTKLQGLQEIDKQLRAGSHPPMYLLGVGDEGNGRAIVSYGNPDASRNVSSYVPGLGTSLDKDFANNDLGRAKQTALDAQERDPSSASIVWLGYDAPQLPDHHPLGNLAVTGTGDAEQGAPAYNRFMDGLGANNHHSDPHFTAIGHSYGSLTVGQAAQRPGGIPGADDIVLVGSPGTGAENADQLNVGKGHVYVGAAENDPVTHLPAKGEVKGGVAGAPFGPLGSYVGAKLGEPDENELWFGKDPASADFGAKRFKVDAGPRPFVDGQGATPAHSNYFNPDIDQMSADNIAAVVAGQSQDVIREVPR